MKKKRRLPPFITLMAGRKSVFAPELVSRSTDMFRFQLVYCCWQALSDTFSSFSQIDECSGVIRACCRPHFYFSVVTNAIFYFLFNQWSNTLDSL